MWKKKKKIICPKKEGERVLCVSEARVLYYLPPAYVTFKYAQTGFLISCCCLRSPTQRTERGERLRSHLSVFARRRTEQHIIHRRCCVVAARAFRCFFFAPQKYVVYIDRYLNSALCVCVMLSCCCCIKWESVGLPAFSSFLLEESDVRKGRKYTNQIACVCVYVWIMFISRITKHKKEEEMFINKN